jgi:hypothetical protein
LAKRSRQYPGHGWIIVEAGSFSTSESPAANVFQRRYLGNVWISYLVPFDDAPEMTIEQIHVSDILFAHVDL